MTARSTDAYDRSDASPTAAVLLEECATFQRRIVLETLCDAESLTLDSLAEAVAARRADVSPEDVDADARERATIGLHHNHLPGLVEAGLVERDEGGKETTITLSPAVEPDQARTLIKHGEGSWESLEALLSDERCRQAVTELSGADGPLSLDRLAETIAIQEREALEGGEAADSVAISLHHVHLPKLDDAGVVDYDVQNRRVELGSLPDCSEFVVPFDAEAGPA